MNSLNYGSGKGVYLPLARYRAEILIRILDSSRSQMKLALTFFTGIAVLAVGSLASADVVLYETDFENPPFTVGNLVPQDGWGNHSGSGSFIQVNSDQAVELVQGSGSREDASVGLGQTAVAGTIFGFEFDVTVSNNVDGASDATTTYFAHFKDDGTGFNSRIFVTAPNTAGNNFTFGIGETSSSTIASTFATDFSFGTTYRLSGNYTFDTGISTLSVDGGASIDSSSQADPGEDLSAWAFRQSGGNTSQVIDNLVVTSNVPEPGTVGVLALFGIAGLMRRRR
jgi:hypothetical protein